MNQKTQLKVAFGILLAIPALPLMGMGFFHNIAAFLIGIVMLIAGIVLLVLGIRDANYKRPELQQFPNEVVINGVHYSKSTFARVNTFVHGSEKVFAIKELREITGVSAEQAKEIVDNWNQYYTENR